MAKTLPGDGMQLDYVSTSISLIMHPRSPRVPTVHMNTRFLSTAQGWFGGGADLTPMLPEQRRPDAPDARDLSRRDAARLRRARSRPTTKNSRRGPIPISSCRIAARPAASAASSTTISTPAISTKDFAFTRDVGLALLDVYPRIVRQRMMEPWTEAERAQQLACRGLYVEFNLLYDRGTMFGLQTGGNIETILSSMPPLVSWS